MGWFFFALIPPFLWASTNFVDQYIYRKYFIDRPFSHISFSMLAYGLILLLILPFSPSVLDITPKEMMTLTFIGVIFFTGLAPYIKALQEEDASNALPLFQVIPFFTVILGWLILGETIDTSDFLAGILIITGGIGMLINFNKGLFSKKVFFLMLLSSLIVALHMVLIRAAAIEDLSWLTVTYWVLFGRMFSGIFLVSASSRIRRDVLGTIRSSRGRALALDFLQNIGGFLATSFLVIAMSKAPASTYVMLVNGLQPLFLILISLALGALLPHHFRAHYRDRYLLFRFGFLIIIISGLAILLLL